VHSLFPNMSKIVIHQDYETYCDLDIGDVGAHRYVRDKSFEILLCALAVGDEEPVVWVNPKLGIVASNREQKRAEEIMGLMSNPKAVIYAHNAAFEVAATQKAFRDATGFKAPKPHQYRCTQAMARRAALPPALGQLGMALHLELEKDSRGNALIKKFCTPQKMNKLAPNTNPKVLAKREERARLWRTRILPTDNAEDEKAFRDFIEYNRRDVVVEREAHRLLNHFELSGDILATFRLDMAINQRGLPVNLDALRFAKKIIDDVQADIGQEFVRLTGLRDTQRDKFLAWLQERGCNMPNMQAATLDEYLEDAEFDTTTEVGRALHMKKMLSYAAVKKVESMLMCAGPYDNLVRSTLIYHGAGPGRWSGSLIQPQNFKRPSLALVKEMSWKELGFKNEGKALAWLTAQAYKDICGGCSKDYLEVMYGPALEVVSSCIRHFIHDFAVCPECGGGGGQPYHPDLAPCWNCGGDSVQENEMLSADYSAIEARIVCWLAGQEDALEQYRQGIDRYRRMACVIFGVDTPDEVNEFPQRFIGKQTILGCGYQMSGPKFRKTCEKFDYYDLEEGLEFTAVKAFRDTHPKIVSLWKSTERAARQAILNPGREFNAGKMTFHTKRTAGMNYLFMRLPSGREISYPKPLLEPCLTYDWKGDRLQILNPTPEDVNRAVRRKGEDGFRLKDVISFYGQLPNGSTQWGRITTYGAKLVENATQGTAADIMAHGAINAERAGYRIATLIHDEALCYYHPWLGQSIDELCSLLTRLPKWADGLPIAAEGKVVKYYSK
jgi:DNA polymerase bacteriophage-type